MTRLCDAVVDLGRLTNTLGIITQSDLVRALYRAVQPAG